MAEDASSDWAADYPTDRGTLQSVAVRVGQPNILDRIEAAVALRYGPPIR
jgi:hypothetical protein